uniref:Uncharacterized protein n=1 Tax=uncultured Actinomycetes bacterium TaxID=152507 RepID=A0A871XYP3_9ACTN|nr:hypothetical protein HULAa32G3_00029 [uncultured Actinomycetes bacterium]
MFTQPIKNPKRQAVFLELKRVDEAMAGMYARGVRLFESVTPDEIHSADMSLICHCFRETLNAVQKSFAIGTVRRTRIDVDQILSLVSRSFSELGKFEIDAKPSEIFVPIELAAQIQNLIDGFNNQKETHIQEFQFMFSSNAQDISYTAKQLKGAYDYFLQWTHLDYYRGEASRTPNLSILEHQIDVVDDAILSLSKAFMENFLEVQSLVLDANSLNAGPDETGNKSELSPAHVKAVLRMLNNPTLKRAFFLELNNLLWVEALENEGAFKNPPQPQLAEDGSVSEVSWPEIDYLKKVASQKRAAVVRIIKSLAGTQNASVKRGVFEIANVVPATYSQQFMHVFRQWAEYGFGYLTDSRLTVGYALNLFKSGHKNEAEWLLNILFSTESRPKRARFMCRLNSYWYAEHLPEVVQTLGGGALQLTLRWLRNYEKRERRLGSQFDYSSFSRPNISERSISFGDVEQSLIDGVRDSAKQAFSHQPRESFKLFRAYSFELTDRILLFSLSQAIQNKDLKENVRNELIILARETLLESWAAEGECWLEYAGLSRLLINRADIDSDYLEAAICIQLGHRSRSFGIDSGKFDLVNDFDRLTDSDLHWLHRTLVAIETGFESKRLNQILMRLEEQFGKLQNRDLVRNLKFGWNSSKSPIDSNDVLRMSPHEFKDYLFSWVSSASLWSDEPSYSGLATLVTQVISEHPYYGEAFPGSFTNLNPIYQISVMQGLRTAIKSNRKVDFSVVEELIREVLELPVSQDLSASMEPRNYAGSAKLTALQLIDEIVAPHLIERIPHDVLERLARDLINVFEGQLFSLSFGSNISVTGKITGRPLVARYTWDLSYYASSQAQGLGGVIGYEDGDGGHWENINVDVDFFLDVDSGIAEFFENTVDLDGPGVEYVGAMAGESGEGASYKNVRVTSTLFVDEGTPVEVRRVGGFIGDMESSFANDVISDFTLVAKGANKFYQVAGFIGYAYRPVISDTSSTSSIKLEVGEYFYKGGGFVGDGYEGGFHDIRSKSDYTVVVVKDEGENESFDIRQIGEFMGHDQENNLSSIHSDVNLKVVEGNGSNNSLGADIDVVNTEVDTIGGFVGERDDYTSYYKVNSNANVAVTTSNADRVGGIVGHNRDYEAFAIRDFIASGSVRLSENAFDSGAMFGKTGPIHLQNIISSIALKANGADENIGYLYGELQTKKSLIQSHFRNVFFNGAVEGAAAASGVNMTAKK